MLDRALDVAAALEVRGYGAMRTPPRDRRRANRHDIAFAAAALCVLALAITARAASLAPFSAYPTLHMPAAASTLAVCGGLLAAALLPFLDRRGITR